KSLVPSAVRNSTVGRSVTKLTGKISGRPSRQVTNRPNDELDRRLQHSSSPSTVTGGPAMDIKRHYRVDVSPFLGSLGHHRAGGTGHQGVDASQLFDGEDRQPLVHLQAQRGTHGTVRGLVSKLVIVIENPLPQHRAHGPAAARPACRRSHPILLAAQRL